MALDEIFESSFVMHSEPVSAAELIARSGLQWEELTALVEFGILEPLSGAGASWTFSSHCVSIVRTAGRLKADFEVNPPGLALALTYLDRIRELEARLAELECRLLG